MLPAVHRAAGRLILRRALCSTASDREQRLLAANAVADKLLSQGQLAKGVEVLGGVLDELQVFRGDRHPDTISVAGHLAQQMIRLDDGGSDEVNSSSSSKVAESLAREAYENARLLWGDSHPDVLLAASTVGQVLAHRGQHQKAEPYMRLCCEAAEERSAAQGDAPGGMVRQELLVASSNLAQVLMLQGRPRDALPHAQTALRESTALLGTHHSDTLDELRAVGQCLDETGKARAAEEVMRLSLERHREVHGYEHPRTLHALSSLARLLGGAEAVPATDQRGLEAVWDEAESLMEEDVRASMRVYGPAHADTLAALSNLAMLLFKRGRHRECMVRAREARRLAHRLPGPAHEHGALLDSLIANSREELQHAEAEARAAKEAAYQSSLLLLASWPSPGASWVQPHAR